MTHNLGKTRLKSESSFHESGKTPFGFERIFIPITRRSYSFVFPHLVYSSQTRIHRHTSVSIHGDKRVYSIPHFQLRIELLLGNHSSTWEDARLYSPLAFFRRFVKTVCWASPAVLFWHSQEKDFVKVSVSPRFPAVDPLKKKAPTEKCCAVTILSWTSLKKVFSIIYYYYYKSILQNVDWSLYCAKKKFWNMPIFVF